LFLSSAPRFELKMPNHSTLSRVVKTRVVRNWHSPFRQGSSRLVFREPALHANLDPTVVLQATSKNTELAEFLFAATSNLYPFNPLYHLAANDRPSPALRESRNDV
jgi:hypothetical protein